MENSSTKPHRAGRKSRAPLIKLAALFIVVVGVVVAVYFLTRGKETVTGDYPNPVETHSLSCSLLGKQYPKITSVDSPNKEIAIAAVFNGTTSLRSLSLTYTLGFHDAEEVEHMNAVAHAEFGKTLGKSENLSFTEFNNKFSNIGTKLTIAVFAEETDFSSSERADYFMIDIKKQGIPKTLKDFRSAYESQGFKCTSTMD